MCAVITRSVRRRSMAGSRSMAGWTAGDSSVAQSVENTESECRPTPVPSSDRHILKDAIAKYKGGRAATLAFGSAPEPPSGPSTHVRDACQPPLAAWSLLHVHVAGARLTAAIRRPRAAPPPKDHFHMPGQASQSRRSLACDTCAPTRSEEHTSELQS